MLLKNVLKLLTAAIFVSFLSGCQNATIIDISVVADRAKKIRDGYQIKIESDYMPSDEELSDAFNVIKANESYLRNPMVLCMNEQLADIYDAAYVLKLSDKKEYKELARMIIDDIDRLLFNKMFEEDAFVFMEDKYFEKYIEGWVPTKEQCKNALEVIEKNKAFINFGLTVSYETIIELYDASLMLGYSDIEEYHELGKMCEETVLKIASNNFYMSPKSLKYLNHKYMRLEKEGYEPSEEEFKLAEETIENYKRKLDVSVNNIEVDYISDIYESSLILLMSNDEQRRAIGEQYKERAVGAYNDYKIYVQALSSSHSDYDDFLLSPMSPASPLYMFR